MLILGISFCLLLWLHKRSGITNHRWAFFGAVGAYLVAVTLPEFRDMQRLSAESGPSVWGHAGMIVLVCMGGMHLVFRSLNPNQTASLGKRA
jgi:hypothetical protein